jgi:hypothetical protein
MFVLRTFTLECRVEFIEGAAGRCEVWISWQISDVLRLFREEFDGFNKLTAGKLARQRRTLE